MGNNGFEKLFTRTEEYTNQYNVKITVYKPKFDMYIDSYDPVTHKPIRSKVIKFTKHEGLLMYSVKPKFNAKDDEIFYVSNDHSLFVYNKLNKEYKRVSPQYLSTISDPSGCGCYKKIYDNLYFIKIKEDQSGNKRAYYVPVSHYEIKPTTNYQVAYDFTVEGTYLFVEQKTGLVVYDTMAIYPVLTKSAQDQIKKIKDPKLQIHPGKFRILGFDNELVSALYYITKNSPDKLKKGKVAKVYKNINQILSDYPNPALLEKERAVYIEDLNWLTTSGRAYISAIMRIKIDYPLTKPMIQSLLTRLYVKYVLIENKPQVYSKIVNLLSRVASKIANRFSISLYDLYDKDVFNIIQEVKNMYKTGLLTDDEFQKKIDEISEYAAQKLSRFEISYKSKTKLHKTLSQMIIARGRVRDMKGRISKPILESYFEGLSDESIFLSAYGSRRGLLDKTQNVADSGYLLRKLIFAVQSGKDMRLESESGFSRNDFCGTDKFLEFKLSDIKHELETRFLYRNAKLIKTEENLDVLNNVITDNNKSNITVNNVIEEKEIVLDFDTINALKKNGKDNWILKIYSPMYCKDEIFCKRCLPDIYVQLTNGFIGMSSAQALCEDLTQSLMRTFHTGGSVESSINLPDEIFIHEDNTFKVARDFKILSITEIDSNVLKLEVLDVENDKEFEFNVNLEELEFTFEVNPGDVIKTSAEFLTIKQKKGKDYKQLTKVIDSYFKTKRFLTPEEFYFVLEPVNCQSLYKEVLIQMCYKHEPTGKRARLYDYKDAVKINIEELPHEGYISSLSFGNPNKFFNKIIELDNKQLYQLIKEESKKSPLTAMCIFDFENL